MMDLMDAELASVLAGLGEHERGTAADAFVSVDHLPRFEYVRACGVEAAVRLLRRFGPRAVLMAGGSDLLRQLKERSRPVQPEVVVHLRPGGTYALDAVAESPSGLSVGALVTLGAVERDPRIQAEYGLLAEAAAAAGPWQQRNMATLGGDLCRRERCWYSRNAGNAYPCRRKGDDGCPALRGDNRYHGVLGGGGCPAVLASETAVALSALGAIAVVEGVEGPRRLAVDDLYSPWGTVLAPHEVVAAVELPRCDPRARSVFLKVGLRNRFDPALASVAVRAVLGEGVCREVRIVLGGVGWRPWRATRAEGRLCGAALTDASAGEAAEAAVAGAQPLARNAYKVDLVRALVRRAIMGLAGG